MKTVKWGIIGCGDVRAVEIRLFKHFDKQTSKELPWRVVPEIAGGGHFCDLASHQIDLLDYYFGAVEEISSVVANLAGHYKAEDHLSVSMRYKRGFLFNGLWSFNSSSLNNQDLFVIYGTKGRITFSTFGFTPVEVLTESHREFFDFPKPKHVQEPMIRAIVNDLLSKRKKEVNGLNGERVNFILEEIVKEFYKD